jgi:hypothetical protein
LPEAGYREVLFHAACAYLGRGWSVIPVHGQGDLAKVAAVEWGTYQRRRCSADEAHRWFMLRGCAGLAVVTGAVSGLAVLDFDDRARFEDFERDHPDLAETYTVQTRRGVHLYYKVYPRLTVESRKAPGVDLQSDGRYVVAPPTVIDGHRYRVIHDAAPKTLTEADIRCLYAFLEGIDRENTPGAVFAASGGVSDSADDLVAMYRHLAAKMGRNDALFRVTLRARDTGWPQEQVIERLAELHVHQPASGEHRVETAEQRRREAVGTIASAFSQPPRTRQTTSGGLPNSVREALLQRRQTATLRVLEGLQLRGLQPGQVFTYRDAMQILSVLVGQWSIRQALAATTSDGQPIFCPSPRPPTPTTVDSEEHEHPSKQRLLIRAPKPTKNPRGRPVQHFYTMPGSYELCERLGVRPSGSDTVTEADVRSASGYRQALHREYIKRRPGAYPRSWLASRLGVSVRTEQRYNVAADIQVLARYDSTLISWHNLNAIADFEVAGTFLQDERGKRYPARQAIAAHLLGRRRMVVYRRQLTNFYRCGDGVVADRSPPDREQRAAKERGVSVSQQVLQTKLARLDALVRVRWADNPLSEEPPSVTDPPAAAVPPAPPSVSAVLPQSARTERRRPRSYRRPLPDSRMEQLAQRVHQETGQGMSVANSRRLLDTYGAQPVGFALKRMVWLRRKGKINSPAGFLVVASRLAWRVQHGATDLGAVAPRFRGEPTR